MFGNKNKISDLPSRDKSAEIRNKIKRIKIFTKRLMKSSIVGDYSSAFKGTGLEFDQIRDYTLGDDIRFIDWNSSAKMSKIMVRELIEERDRTVILVIDISGSSLFSSKPECKRDVIAQVGAALALIAQENKDKVGALFFSDKIEKWIPPSRGNAHFAQILENLFSLKAESLGTNIQEVLNFLVGLKKRNSVVFMLSDWIDDVSDYSKILRLANCEYDFVSVRFLDDCEKELPDIGLLEIQDLETDEFLTIDTKNKKNSIDLNVLLKERIIKQKKMFEKNRIDLLDLTIGRSFINPMINFFRQRIRRQI